MAQDATSGTAGRDAAAGDASSYVGVAVPVSSRAAGSRRRMAADRAASVPRYEAREARAHVIGAAFELFRRAQASLLPAFREKFREHFFSRFRRTRYARSS